MQKASTGAKAHRGLEYVTRRQSAALPPKLPPNRVGNARTASRCCAALFFRVGLPIFHYRVVAGVRERVAAQQAGQGHQASTQNAVAVDRFHGIFRTGGNEAARWRQHWRNRPLVGSQELQHNEFGKLAHDYRLPAFGFPLSELGFSSTFSAVPFLASFCSMTTKAWRTSFTMAANCVVNSDFFGLMTTSALAIGQGRFKRTASRK